MVEVESSLEGQKSEASNEARMIAHNCKCLPACTSIEYESETSQADYDWKAIFRVLKLDYTEMDEE